MKSKLQVISLAAACLCFSTTSNACMEHYGYGAGANHGFFNYSPRIPDLSEFAPDAKVFKLNHPTAAVAEVKKEETLELDYELPADASNVQVTISGTNNITIIDQVIDLKEQSGKVVARFLARKKGINAITVTIAGDHGGERLSYTSELYIKAKKST